jgi:hypothetical protein
MGKNPGVDFRPKTPTKRNLISKYFIRGWWTDEQDKPITEALCGDTVKFHLEMQHTTDGDEVFMTLYDDDTKVKPLEDHKDDPIKLVGSASGKNVVSSKVSGNKIVKLIVLDNFETFLKEEADKELELFFKCKYKEQEVGLPHNPEAYLKLKGMPKIIFVNGQWKLASRAPFGTGENFGPTKPKKPYWYDGDRMVNSAKSYFEINDKFKFRNLNLKNDELEKKNFILYYDGSSNWGADQSGGDRFSNGKKFAEKNFAEIIKGLGDNKVYFISHSEGGAYAAGMADYLHSKGIKIGEHILLSPDEGDEFSINSEIPSYQLTYMFFSSIWNPTGTFINSEKFKMANKGFRKWGRYYAIVDWVTNEFKVKGTKKMGIVRDDNLGWGTVHGSTNDSSIFNQLKDLKNVTYFDVIGSYDEKAYSGTAQSTVANNTIFYRIDDQYISVNCPPISKVK